MQKITYVGDARKGGGYIRYPVLIIGAGESGIAMGCRLKQVLGFDQFRIFDKRAGLGGTWYTNHYPGVACDVPAFMYSFSFAQNPQWSKMFPPGPEIRRYLNDVCTNFGIHDKIQYNTSVKGARWRDSENEWEVELEHLAPGIGDLSNRERRTLEESGGPTPTVIKTEMVRAKVLVSCVGAFGDPKPHVDVPGGFDAFEGKIVHTATWNEDLDFKDKNVVVVGGGCSAAQVVPQLVKPNYGAKSVTQLIRTPPWVTTFPDNPKDRPMLEKWLPILFKNIPGFQNAVRKFALFASERFFMTVYPDTRTAAENRKVTAKQYLGFMRSLVPEEYHEILTPDYDVGCKRRVYDDGWLTSLHDERITLSTQPMTKISARTATIGPGRHYPDPSRTESKAPTSAKEIPVDVIVFANGYDTHSWLHPIDFRGRGGRSLHETWKDRGGAQAYMCTAMDGFPNLFMVTGPNSLTGHSSVILATEILANFALKFIGPVVKGEVSTWEVKEGAQRQWTHDIQEGLKHSVFGAGGCTSWYMTEDGWNSTTYPRSQLDLIYRARFPTWSDWTVTRTNKGISRRRLRLLLRTLAFLSLLGVFGWDRNSNGSALLQRLRGLLSLQALKAGLVELRALPSKSVRSVMA